MFTDPTQPTGSAAILLELIEAADAANEHGEEYRREHISGDLRVGTGIPHRAPEFAQAKDFVSVSEETC